MTRAVRRTPQPKPEPETRSYRVLSNRCVWGKQGEVIQLALGAREEALLRAGTLERAEEDSDRKGERQ